MPNRFRLLSAKGEESGLAVRILVAEDEVWPDHPNALLIAAAPEMLEALRELLRWSGSDDTIAGPEIAARSAARAAIRKAGLLS